MLGEAGAVPVRQARLPPMGKQRTCEQHCSIAGICPTGEPHRI